MTKNLKQIDDIQQVFEDYSAEKYKKWKTTAQKTTEHIAFDEYIAKNFPMGKVSGAYLTDFNQKDLDEGWHKFNTNSTNRPDVLPEACWGVMQIIYENGSDKTGTQIIYPIDKSMKGRIFSRSVLNNRTGVSPVLGNWMKYMIQDDVYTREEADQTFAPIGGGGGGGGQPRPPIVLPTDTVPLKTITGSYGMNFFDYRSLTENPQIALNGKTFYNKVPIHTTSADSNSPKHTRIRKHDTINFKYRLFDTTSTKKVDFTIYPTASRGQNITLQFDVGGRGDKPKVWKTKTASPTDYSYASYLLGSSVDDSVPQKARMEVSGYYGEIEPKGKLDQSFVFKRYNGIDLIGLQTYNAVSGAKETIAGDEYSIYRRRTTIKKKFNVLKLKDVQQYSYGETGDKFHLLIPVPDDCKDQTKHLMSNNLCDISAEESEQSLPSERRPFFVRELTSETFKDIHRDENTQEVIYDKTGRPELVDVQKNCFTIMISHDNIREWQKTLEETEIIYEVDSALQTEQLLPTGGQIYVLTDGTRIHTCMYGKVEAGKGAKENKFVISFTESPFGMPDVKMLVDDVIEVIDDTGFKEGGLPYTEHLPQFLPFEGEEEETQIQTIPE